jgi:hypothetical protein
MEKTSEQLNMHNNIQRDATILTWFITKSPHVMGTCSNHHQQYNTAVGIH